MLHGEPLGSNGPDGAGLCVDGGDSGQWTEEKRRKHLGPSPPRGGDTTEVADSRISSSCSSYGPGGEEEAEHTICKASWEEEEELDSIGEVLDEEFRLCEDALSKRPQICLTQRELDLEPQRQVYQRHVLYRIRAHKLSQGESIDNLGDEALLKELPLFLKLDVSQWESRCDLEFCVSHYIRSLEIEKGDTFDWYFDRVYSRFEELEDYQRLVLRNRLTDEGYEFWSWAEYHSKLTTYEMDKDYVEFFEVVSSKLRWLKSYVRYPERSDEWSEVYLRGLRQVFKIASGPEFPHLTSSLAHTAYDEHIWSWRFDYYYREGMDRLFFEIWRCIATRQTAFAVALRKILCENLVPRHQGYMQDTLNKPSSSDLEERYNSCVEGVPDNASEEVAKVFIIEAVWKRHKKANKRLHQYMAKKMKIAKSIGLVK